MSAREAGRPLDPSSAEVPALQQPVTATFPAEPRSAGQARRRMVAAAVDWGLDRLADDVASCTAELATNAFLHSRGQFTVAARRTARGLRIEVQDDHPDRPPVLSPALRPPFDTGTTGRGLRMISALAERWGYYTTPRAKTVWAELSLEATPGAPTPPVVELGHDETASFDIVVEIHDLPVTTAILSGAQVDEIVRELQLSPDHVADADLAALFTLLERTLTARLTGRQEAFRAHAAGLDRYSFSLPTTRDQLAALGDLNALLMRLANASDLEARTVPGDVLEMRRWVATEAAAQLAGAAPTSYP